MVVHCRKSPNETIVDRSSPLSPFHLRGNLIRFRLIYILHLIQVWLQSGCLASVSSSNWVPGTRAELVMEGWGWGWVNAIKLNWHQFDAVGTVMALLNTWPLSCSRPPERFIHSPFSVRPCDISNEGNREEAESPPLILFLLLGQRLRNRGTASVVALIS